MSYFHTSYLNNMQRLCLPCLAVFIFTLSPAIYAGYRPPALVTVGDSFVSGEGAGNYRQIEGHSFPGWSSNVQLHQYFCHRSFNAATEIADLEGIEARFNFACSGGRPSDIGDARGIEDGGRGVMAQLDAIMRIAESYDIKIIHIGLGSNNSQFSFGKIATNCIDRFFKDAYLPVGSEAFGPCMEKHLPPSFQVARAKNEVVDAVDLIIHHLSTLQDGEGKALYPPGSYRIIMQDYTNPFPEDYYKTYIKAKGISDEMPWFRKLAWRRYRGGCPIHRRALRTTHYFSRSLGAMVSAAQRDLATSYPNHDIIYLNVQHAFDGVRLCENPASPRSAVVSPVRIRDDDGSVFFDFEGYSASELKKATKNCKEAAQRCQESLHPAQSGQRLLAHCLEGAAQARTRVVHCSRNTDTGDILTEDKHPVLDVTFSGQREWKFYPEYGRPLPYLKVDYRARVNYAGANVSNWNISVVNNPDIVHASRSTTSKSGSLEAYFDPQVRIAVLQFRVEARFDGKYMRKTQQYEFPFNPGLCRFAECPY